MKRCIILSVLAFAAALSAKAQNPSYDYTLIYADRDTMQMVMDVYMPEDTASLHPCMLYLYGGGFAQNNLRSDFGQELCRSFADAGFVTVAVDYRLGLRGVKFKSHLQMMKPLESSMKMAAEDLLDAVGYILAHADELKVDPSKLMLSGSSAGAMTVLQADYELCNRTTLAAGLPEDFRFAAVVSCAGAVFSKEGKCDYTVHSPAPTFFLHGTSDKLVIYDKTQFFKVGLFGSNALVKRFEKFGWPYMIARFEGNTHEVAGFNQFLFKEILWFIDKYVNEGKNWQIDLNCQMPEWEGHTVAVSPADCYK